MAPEVVHLVPPIPIDPQDRIANMGVVATRHLVTTALEDATYETTTNKSQSVHLAARTICINSAGTHIQSVQIMPTIVERIARLDNLAITDH